MLSFDRRFPKSRPSDALRAEDAFMQEHGGTGPYVIFLIVSFICDLPVHLRALRLYPKRSRAMRSKIVAPIGIRSSGKS